MMRYLKDLTELEQAQYSTVFATAKFLWCRYQPKDGLYWHKDYLYQKFQIPRYVLKWPIEILQEFSDAFCRDSVQKNAIELHHVPVFLYGTGDYDLTTVGNMCYIVMHYSNEAVKQKALLWLESLEKHFTVSK